MYFVLSMWEITLIIKSLMCSATTSGEKTESAGPGPIKDECPTELQALHTTIQEMQAKLDSYKNLEVEKIRLESGEFRYPHFYWK